MADHPALSPVRRGPGRAARSAAVAATILSVLLTGAAPAPAAPPPVPPELAAATAELARLTGRAGDMGTTAALAVGASTVTAGDEHSCALTIVAEIWCWGDNGSGQLGVANPPADSAVPVQVTATGALSGRTITQVDAGAAHTCVVDDEGDVLCWGENGDGQLGVNSTLDSDEPVLVPGLGPVVKVTAGTAHTCALLVAGTVSCWGRNTSGQLGAAAGAPVLAPQLVVGPTGLVDVAAHRDDTCAVRDSGGAWCWGDDSAGQLGDGPATAPAGTPVEVDTDAIGDPQFVQIDVGRRHACALDGEGVAYCWGSNAVGQLGTGGGPAGSDVPVPVESDGRPLLLVDLGADGGCATQVSLTVLCWGENGAGQLGTGGTTDRAVPTPVDGPPGLELFGEESGLAVEVATADTHTCAVEVLGSVFCWGANAAGQLGDRTRTAGPAPVRTVLGPGPTTELALEPGDRSFEASWQAPAEPGVGELLGSVVSAVSASGSTGGFCVVVGAERRCTVDGLVAGERYGAFVITMTTTGASVSSAAYSRPGGGQGGGGSLPVTGAGLPAYLGVAGVLLAVGVALLVPRRRRPRFVA